jgi:ketosteroid isomerase-like protein
MAIAVSLNCKPAPTSPSRPVVLGVCLAFPVLGRRVAALVLALPHGRLRRVLIEWTMREAVVGSFNRRDFDRPRAFVSADFESWPAERIATVLGITDRRLRGYDAFHKYLQDWVDAWGTFTIEPKRIVDLGNSVVLLNHMRGQGPGSGIDLDGQEEAQFYEFKAGRCVRFRQYWSWQEALEAVGLRD